MILNKKLTIETLLKLSFQLFPQRLGFYLVPKMKSGNQDRYWPDYGKRAAENRFRCDSTQSSGKVLGGDFWSGQLQFLSVGSGQNKKFGLFVLANIRILVCLIWSVTIFCCVWCYQYQHFGLFMLANTFILKIFWSGQNGQT